MNVPFERFKFNSRSQGAGEPFDLYVTTLRQLAARCNFAHVTEEDLLRDRIIFDIHNLKLKGRLLREADLTLSKCLEICRAAELSSAQLKEVTRLNDSLTISAVNARRKMVSSPGGGQGQGQIVKECHFCGQEHVRDKMACPAWGKQRSLCKKFNHLRAKCYKLCGVQSLATETTQEPQELQLNEKERERNIFTVQVRKINSVNLTNEQTVTLKETNTTSDFSWTVGRLQYPTGSCISGVPKLFLLVVLSPEFETSCDPLP